MGDSLGYRETVEAGSLCIVAAKQDLVIFGRSPRFERLQSGFEEVEFVYRARHRDSDDSLRRSADVPAQRVDHRAGGEPGVLSAASP